jgi:hypothetical protein
MEIDDDGPHRSPNPPPRSDSPEQSGAVDPGQPTSEGASQEPCRISAGEIIGYRAWRVRDGKLRSCYFDQYEWQPNVPMSGRCEDPDPRPEYMDNTLEGVHAWRDLADAKNYVRFIIENPGTATSWFSQTEPPVDEEFVWGEVELYGTVWEHDLGYRAQYARVKTILNGTKKSDLPTLRALYLKRKRK